MYRDDRALEERVEHLEARLAEVQDELRAARADAPKPRKRALEAQRKELRAERRALRRERKRAKPVEGDEKKRPFWVVAFWYTLEFLDAAAGGSPSGKPHIPSTRDTLKVILFLLCLAAFVGGGVLLSPYLQKLPF